MPHNFSVTGISVFHDVCYRRMPADTRISINLQEIRLGLRGLAGALTTFLEPEATRGITI